MQMLNSIEFNLYKVMKILDFDPRDLKLLMNPEHRQLPQECGKNVVIILLFCV